MAYATPCYRTNNQTQIPDFSHQFIIYKRDKKRSRGSCMQVVFKNFLFNKLSCKSSNPGHPDSDKHHST